MAIVNVSPDSFSGDGITDTRQLSRRLQTAISEGADILDIGGQSTRPRAEIVSDAEETRRVVPAIERARALTDKPLSVDTFKPAVARAALAAGATMVNDVTGCGSEQMITLIRDHGAEVVVMHSRGTPKTMTKLTRYPRGLIVELLEFFRDRTARLASAGIRPERILIDPGIGFAKTAEQSFEATRQLARLRSLGFRIVYGSSMKSFLGRAVSGAASPAPLDERKVATTVTTAYAIMQGADIVRVHDVKAAVEARWVLECIANPAAVAPIGREEGK